MPARVMVSVPTFDRSMKAATAESIGNAIDFAESEGMLDGVVHHHVSGYAVATARNAMAQAAMDEGVDYLWMVDSDMVVPHDALSRLLSHDVEVCTGWAVRGSSDDGTTSVIKPYSQGFHDSYNRAFLRGIDDELILVKGNGMACALLRTDVFRRFPRPWFKFVEHANGEGLSEDYWFCQQCATAGVSVWVDPRVGCGHIHDRVLEAM